ncbi:MAG: NAD-dependent deacylase [Tagaea sp.]|nr:NAD-dependent deacylase [Tagaea sp.]
MAGSIVILTGAGISKESGIDTFRDAGGVWSQVRIEDVATPSAFARDPQRVQDFYNMRRRGLRDPKIAPNAAHAALARLEAEWTGKVTIVTQNIDDLHERAGSRNLLHIHGELLKSRCFACGDVREVQDQLTLTSVCPACENDGTLRPHVVWFNELPLFMDEAIAEVQACAIFVSIGTSGSVYPAAGLVEFARLAGARTVELNLEPSEGASNFDEKRYGVATALVPEFVAELLGS